MPGSKADGFLPPSPLSLADVCRGSVCPSTGPGVEETGRERGDHSRS